MKLNILKIILLALLIGIILEGRTVVYVAGKRILIYPSFTVFVMIVIVVIMMIIEAYQMYKKYKTTPSDPVHYHTYRPTIYYPYQGQR